MNPVSIIIGLALLAATIPWVATPILDARKRKPSRERVAPVVDSDPYEENLHALRDLEFDHRTGKVTDADYIALRADLLSQIAASLEAKEKINAKIDALLEKKIQSRRLSKPDSKACGQCGIALEPTDRFCRSCGAPVDEICTKCGGVIHAVDQFCSTCGTPVPTRQLAA